MSGEDRDPKDSFIHQYVDFTREQESPLSFHLWTALTILGVVMGRKCYINRGFYTIYPNLFTLLVAGSALCRKSTAIDIGIDLLRDIPDNRILIISGKITPEKFTNEIANAQQIDIETKEWTSPSVIVFSSELSVFLTKQSYGEPIIHILTDLFGCPNLREFKTKHSGVDTLRNVFVSIIAATTPTGAANGIPESALEEGFASRLMPIFEHSTDRSNAFPEFKLREQELLARCKQMLLERSALEGEFRLSTEAKAWFQDWYDNIYKKSNPKDRRMSGFFGRKHDHLLRVAMLLAGSFNEREMLVGDCEAALAAVEAVENTALGAFQEIGSTGISGHYARFKTLMLALKRVGHSFALKHMYPCTATEFKEVLATAFQSGLITRDQVEPSIYVLLPGNDKS